MCIALVPRPAVDGVFQSIAGKLSYFFLPHSSQFDLRDLS